MHVPKHWARETQSAQDPQGRWLKFNAWRWSDSSPEDAAISARERVRDLIAKVQRGAALNRYSYGERPLREETLQAVPGDGGQDAGIVTRNAYGVEVLNTANAMFMDIDLSEEASGSVSGLMRALRGAPVPTQEANLLGSIERESARNPGLGLRVYRTRAGLRCLVTNELFDPAAQSTLDLMRLFGSDPLYIRLCRAQGCFRARLSPKPWRIHINKPPSRYPWQDARDESKYRAWESKYKGASTQYAVCQLIKTLGSDEVHPQIQPILTLHDRMCGVDEELPLA